MTIDLKDLAIKYLETLALRQLSKEQLIEMVLDLQKHDKELFDWAVESNAKKDKRIKELRNQLIDTQMESDRYKRVADLKLGHTYNVNATWIDKIVFVLKAAKRPLRSSEIINILLQNDYLFRTLTDPVKGLSAHLTKAQKYGRIVGVKQKGQNGYLFSLPKAK